ncbi:MAG: hypothetical protein HN380_33030, partial [Victivallales bacterium]|nr:hypothetical protein [Victivallales bacterium]
AIAGTAHGLFLLGPDLQPVARRPGGVEDIALLPQPGQEPIVAAVLSDGRVVAVRVKAAVRQ